MYEHTVPEYLQALNLNTISMSELSEQIYVCMMLMTNIVGAGEILDLSSHFTRKTFQILL